MDGCHAIDQLDDLLLRVFPCPLNDTRNNPILCKSFSTIVWSIACAEIGGDLLTNYADSLLLDLFKQLIIFTHDTSDYGPVWGAVT